MTPTSDASGVYAPSSGAPQFFGHDTGACDFSAAACTAAVPYWPAQLPSNANSAPEQPAAQKTANI